MVKRCRHCNHTPANKPRGLCWHCYYIAPGVRDLYPRHPRLSARDFCDNDYQGFDLPAETTLEPPGSPGKIAAMTARAEVGVNLFHPQDAGMEAWAGREGEMPHCGYLPILGEMSPEGESAAERRGRIMCSRYHSQPRGMSRAFEDDYS